VTDTTSPLLTRGAASGAVEAIGWRYLLGSLVASVPVGSLTEGARLATAIADAAGPDADGHLQVDLRPARVELSLRTRSAGGVTQRDVDLAHALSTVITSLGGGAGGPVQQLEIAIDALDIPAVLPFWRAVLAFEDGPDGQSVVDPAGLLPAVWFQQMDAARPQRNRIHLDVTVAHDEAEGRVRAALGAGGVLVSDAHARAFWVLADAEGNEACVCTWQDRPGG
jgi:4a-hydroxytetrahydrobiopterin dehydratase